MNNKVTDQDIDKTCHISEMAQEAVTRVMQGGSDDVSNFDCLLSDEGVRSELEGRFSSDSKLQQVDSKLKAVNKEEQVKNLVSEILKLKRKQFLRRVSLISTGVAAALVVVTFLVWSAVVGGKQEYDSEEVVAVMSDVLRPTIKLSSGEQITVDDISELMCFENTTLRKLDDSTVEYVFNADTEISEEVTINKEPTYNTIIVPAHYTSTVRLEDGTEVTLNAGSTLRFPSAFSGEKREVELSGEAFFNVAKSDKPFIVKVDTLSVKVYGTQFNINASKVKIETVLVSGSVSVTLNEEESMLKPNECFSYDKVNGDSEIRDVDADSYLGWVNGEFFYVNKDIYSVLNDVANWYGVNFMYSKSQFGDCQVNMYISRERSVMDVIKMLELTINSTILNEGGGRYIILGK